MPFRGSYPIFVTERLEEAKAFWMKYFAFQALFESSWIVLVGSPEDQRVQIAYMHPEHPSSPPGPEEFEGFGMCLELEVDSVDEILTSARAAGFVPEYGPKNEPWGERRFGFRDPAGVRVDILERIAPAEGFWDPYVQG